jgi:hypothetical protein
VVAWQPILLALACGSVAMKLLVWLLWRLAERACACPQHPAGTEPCLAHVPIPRGPFVGLASLIALPSPCLARALAVLAVVLLNAVPVVYYYGLPSYFKLVTPWQRETAALCLLAIVPLLGGLAAILKLSEDASDQDIAARVRLYASQVRFPTCRPPRPLIECLSADATAAQCAAAFYPAREPASVAARVYSCVADDHVADPINSLASCRGLASCVPRSAPPANSGWSSLLERISGGNSPTSSCSPYR